MSVFEKHRKELRLYEASAGKLRGRLMFAIAILSDVQSILLTANRETLYGEIDEAKTLISSVINEGDEVWR